jgi:hypothetical protein
MDFEEWWDQEGKYLYEGKPVAEEAWISAIDRGIFGGECRDDQTAFFARLAKDVWDSVRLQGATPREAIAMIYRAGGDHRIEAEKLARSNA